MYKKIFCSLIVTFCINAVIGQGTDSIKLILEYKLTHVIDTTQPSTPLIRRYILLLGSKISLYDDYSRTMEYLGAPVSKTYTDASGISKTAPGSGGGDQLYTDFSKQKLITVSFLLDKWYVKEDTLTKIEWTLRPEKREILHYKCQMATTTFKGRNYTVWFTPSLAASAGPWKLHGLPGIILAANDDKNQVIFECTKISAPTINASAIAISRKAIPISAEKFQKVQQALEKDPMAGKGASAQVKGNIVATNVAIGDLPSGARPRTMNNPIEKE